MRKEVQKNDSMRDHRAARRHLFHLESTRMHTQHFATLVAYRIVRWRLAILRCFVGSRDNPIVVGVARQRNRNFSVDLLSTITSRLIELESVHLHVFEEEIPFRFWTRDKE
mmetsp:Transcript_5162/g.16243  ORF Transcript_5162/g.16243 Transcript_5162/m.16243 type:complete len:111 (-) Transcript_5162:866-1198(-)